MKLHLLVAATLVAASSSHAALLVQETFDGYNNGAALGGQGIGTATVGLTGLWTANAGAMATAVNFDVTGTPGLSEQGVAGQKGGIWNNSGSYASNIWATINLTSAVSNSTAQTLYFSYKMNNGGDTGNGFGLATGSTGTDRFIGISSTWNNVGGGVANTLATSYGALSGGTTNTGAWANYGAAGILNGAATVVGRITFDGAGNNTIQSKFYTGVQTIENNLSAIVWTTQGTTTAAGDYTKLLVWTNGVGTGDLDAFRLGTQWVDVTGVTAVPEPSTYGLMGAGALAAVAFVRRRRKAAGKLAA